MTEILYGVMEFLIGWIAIMLSILFHEAGHLSGWKMSSRSKCWRITAGSGKKLFGAGRISFHLLPFGGTFEESDEAFPATKKDAVLMCLGGPLFTLILTLALFFVQRVIPADAFGMNIRARQLVIFVRNYNLILFLITAIPWKYPKFLSPYPNSDGMAALKYLRDK